MDSDTTTVRIAVVGDDGVGKTRFIRTCLAEDYVDDDPSLSRVLPPINLVKKDEVTTLFMDTGNSEEYREEFEAAISSADICLLLYKCGPLNDENSAQQIRQKVRSWLQKIRAVRGGEENTCPVVLVGTHLDARLTKKSHFDPHDIDSVSAHFAEIENFRYQEEMQPIFSEYKEVESGYETSSSFLVNVQGAMIAAHRTVLFPMAPIYDAENKKLTAKFTDRLRRIFTLCDLDGDGALNEQEIQYFNHRTFDEKIPEKDLQQVQRVAKYNNANYVDENDAIKFEGFLFWITVFVEKQEEEVAWSVLYEWGYNRKLNLSPEFLFPNNEVYHLGDSVKDPEIALEDMLGPDPHVVQISKEGVRFLRQLYARYANKDTNLLPVSSIADMFTNLSESGEPEVACPFDASEILAGRVVPIVEADMLDLGGFLGLWNWLLANDAESVERLVRCAVFLGYQHEREDRTALFVKWCFQPERKNRTLFHVLVLSASSEGQVSRALVSRLSGVSNPGKVCVGKLGGDERFIRFKTAVDEGQLTIQSDSYYDLVVFAFENSIESVEYCHKYAQQINADGVLRQSLPMIFVYVPTNDEEKNNAKVLSNQICRSLGLPLPLPVACEEDWGFFRDRFNNCLLVSASDHKIPSRSAFKMIFGGLIFVGLGFAGYYLYTKYVAKDGGNGND